MRLDDRLSEVPADATIAGFDASAAGREIVGLSADSRRIGPGFAFFASPGNKTDGLSFVAEAVANGATAIIAEHLPEAAFPGIASIKVADARRALAFAAAKFFGLQPETIAAETGA